MQLWVLHFDFPTQPMTTKNFVFILLGGGGGGFKKSLGPLLGPPAFTA